MIKRITVQYFTKLYVVVVVVFIDFYYKVTETFIAIEDLSVLKEEVLEGNITREI